VINRQTDGRQAPV